MTTPTRDEILSFLKQFSAESERASVILAAAVLDNALESLLVTHLVKPPTRADDLFSRGKPLAGLGPKIDLAYRLGLLSPRLRKDLHRIREIRNDFAHSPESASLATGRPHDISRELFASLLLDSPMHRLRTNQRGTPKTLFMIAAAMLFAKLRNPAWPPPPISARPEEPLYDATRWFSPEPSDRA